MRDRTGETLPDHGEAVWKEPAAIALLMAATMIVMGNATISPALPGLEQEFAGQDHAALLTRLLVPAPALGAAISAPIAGLLIDRFGRRAMLLLGTIGFVITGMAGFVLPDVMTIFISRILLGITVGMVMTAQTALVGDYFQGYRRSAVVGLQVSARNLVGFLCIVLAGWLAGYAARLPFLIYGLAGLYLPYIWWAISEPARRQGEAHGTAEKPAEEGAGQAMMAPAWKSLLAGLIFLQMLTNLVFFTMPTQLPFFLADKGYPSASTTGFVLGALTLAGGTIALFYGRLRRIYDVSVIFVLGFAMMALGFGCLSLGGPLWSFVLGAMAVGIGYATVMPNFMAAMLALAPASHRGRASGLLSTAIFVGQFISPFISMPAIAALGFDGALAGFAVVPGMIALGALIVWVLTRRTALKRA